MRPTYLRNWKRIKYIELIENEKRHISHIIECAQQHRTKWAIDDIAANWKRRLKKSRLLILSNSVRECADIHNFLFVFLFRLNEISFRKSKNFLRLLRNRQFKLCMHSHVQFRYQFEPFFTVIHLSIWPYCVLWSLSFRCCHHRSYKALIGLPFIDMDFPCCCCYRRWSTVCFEQTSFSCT